MHNWLIPPNGISSQILNEVQLFLVLKTLLLEQRETARHWQLLPVRPVVIHLPHVDGVRPWSLLPQTYQCPRIQVRMVSVAYHYSQVANCVVNHLLRGGWAGFCVREYLLWLFLLLQSLLLLLSLLLFRLFQKVVFAYGLDESSWSV